MNIYCKDQTALEKAACLLGKCVSAGDIIVLEGELGAGKTTFTKSLAKSIGIKKVVKSPTFTILKQYDGKLPLYHFDAYRLEGGVDTIGFDDYFYGSGVCVIEWGQFIKTELPEVYLEITIEYILENERKLKIKAFGKRYDELLRRWRKLGGKDYDDVSN